jgi:toxin-antitoxin system PIN domain toxin
VTFLLDVNVLIALIDPAHISHNTAHHWFESVGKASWATCPITENGVIRIVGHASYPNTPGSTADVAAIMAKMCELPGHVFWPDSLSLTDAAQVDASQVLTSAQVTDTYLLALARANDGKLATFDRRLSIKAVKGGKEILHIIGNS